MKVKMNQTNFILLMYILFSTLFFIFLAIPSLNGEIHIRFYTDALQYEDVAKKVSSFKGLITASGNFLGPVIIVKMFHANRFLIFVFNVILFVLSYKMLSKTFNLNNNKFLLLLIINPMIFLSLMSVNKEILAILSISLLICYTKNKRILFFILSLFLSIFVRWQMTLATIIIFIAISRLAFVFSSSNSIIKAIGTFVSKCKLEIIFKKRIYTILAMVIVISIIYPFFSHYFNIVENLGNYFFSFGSGTGIYMKLNTIQNFYFGYVLVYIPKVLQNLMGNIIGYKKAFHFTDFYNDVVVFIQALFYLYLLLSIFLKKKFSLANDFFFISILYSIVFGLTPFVQNRYFIPVYILLSMLLTSTEKEQLTYDAKG